MCKESAIPALCFHKSSSLLARRAGCAIGVGNGGVEQWEEADFVWGSKPGAQEHPEQPQGQGRAIAQRSLPCRTERVAVMEFH